MAFAGLFINQIRNVVNGKSNLSTTAGKLAEPFDNDDSNISSSSSSSNDNAGCAADNDSRNEYTEANYRGVLDSDLTALTAAQKNIFIVTVSVLFVLSLCGNVGTLFVNFRRKIRPFFRACLVSLAFSDLMNTVFLTASYLSQFTADFVQIWSLGNVMCSLVPFATTCAILASSMTLVGIALDRYFAVMKAVIGFWNPSVISCIACMLCIWLAAISIACPVFTFYNIIPVYILTAEPQAGNATDWAAAITAAPLLPTETDDVPVMPKKYNIAFTANLQISSVRTMRAVMAAKMATATKTEKPWGMEASLENLSYTVVRKTGLVNMCLSDQDNVSAYYIIVFTIIFVPCIVAFIWFNAVIARKLWQRRHLASVTKHSSKIKSRTQTKPTTTCPPSSTEPTQTDRPKCVLIQKSNPASNSTTTPTSMSNTSYGQVNALGCSGRKPNASHSREARHLRMFVIILLMMAVFMCLRLPAWIFLLMRLYGSYRRRQCWILYFIFGLMNLTSSVLNPLFYTFLTETLKYALKLKAQVSSFHCGRLLQKSYSCENFPTAGRCSSLFCCHQTSSIADHKYNVQTHSLQSEVQYKDGGPGPKNETDEGVDCNDEVDGETVCSARDYDQRIYTIYPTSLVSSSINSEN